MPRLGWMEMALYDESQLHEYRDDFAIVYLTLGELRDSPFMTSH